MFLTIDIRHRENFKCKKPPKNMKKPKIKKEKASNHIYLNIRCRLLWKIGRWSKIRWGYHGWKTFMEFSQTYSDRVNESIEKINKQIEYRKEFESKVELRKATIKIQQKLNLKLKNKKQGKLSFNELKHNCVRDAIIKAYQML